MNCLRKLRKNERRTVVCGALVYTFFVCYVIVRCNWHSSILRTSPVQRKISNSVEGNDKESTTLEDSSLHEVRFTRLGNEIAFNSSMCPRDSLLRNGTLQKYLGKKIHKCPRLFIIGAKKGGTTSLYNYTAQHPDFQGIQVTNVSSWFGETHFFAHFWGTVPLTEYLSQFPTDKMSGDASVDNLVHCKAPSRIFATCGADPKVIVLLRDPLERYISNFMMRITRGGYVKFNSSTSISVTTSHEICILSNRLKHGAGISLRDLNISADWSKLVCLFKCCVSMIYEGLYYVSIMNWLCNFPSQNLMIINSEEMFRQPVLVLKQVFSFIGLKPLDDATLTKITSSVSNRTPRSSLPQHQLSMRDRKLLLSVYRPFNKELLDLLDWHNVSWSTL